MASGPDKPDQIYPKSSLSVPSAMPNQIIDPSIKGQNFEQLINNRGIRFMHRKAAPCPNMKSVDDNNHDPSCTVCNGDGILFYCEKEIYGLFSSNSLQKNFEQQGLWEIGTAVITLPDVYPDGEQADFNTFDQLYIPDFTVRMWQIYEQGSSNEIQFRYPVQKTELMTSIDNNVRTDYEEGVDFNINASGNIEWVQGKAPAYDSVNDLGEVLTCVYYSHPVYNVLQHMRELRVTNELVNGQKVARRLPQQILVKRDFLFNPADGE